MKDLILHRRFYRLITGLTAIGAGLALATPPAEGSIIWNGPPTAYTQPSPDPTQPANQDRLTADVWLTRGTTAGLFNAAMEAFFTRHFSPTNTEWAFGELNDYASLSYTNWEDSFGGNLNGGPASTIGKDMVVHLISDDIYLAIRLTFWGGSGGGFSYIRSTPIDAPPPPRAPVVTGAALSGDGTFQLTFTNTPGFTNIPGYTFTVLGTTNLSLPLTNWTVLGQATDAPTGSGLYQFSDPGTGTNSPRRFYGVRWP